MRIESVVAGVLLAVAAGTVPAQERSSPYDANPRCTERTTDSNSRECVIEQEGQPRQFYPPPARKVAPPPPPKPPPPQSPPSPPMDLKRAVPRSG